MLPLQKIKKEVADLSEKWWDFICILEEITEDNFDDFDWANIAAEFEECYRRALQLMQTTEYSGMRDFAALYEDSSFSIPRFLVDCTLFIKKYDPELIAVFNYRLFQMYFILIALPKAIESIRVDETLKPENEEINSQFHKAYAYLE
ncbi:MAG: hypothetical protein ABIK49_01110, partial [candidate division WOR-3 bacterium]